jgi:hypothetical protein
MWTFGGSADGSSSAHAHEGKRQNAAVVAPHRCFAGRAAVNVMWPPAVGWSCNGPGLAGQILHPIRFYQRVEYEGAAGLPLTIPTVAAVHEHRLQGEPIAQRAASATSFERQARWSPLESPLEDVRSECCKDQCG